jgi:hypothetical protein
MPQDRWEYRSVRFDVGGWIGPKLDLAELDATLNAIGSEGWELVNALDLSQSDGKSRALLALFKRRR